MGLCLTYLLRKVRAAIQQSDYLFVNPIDLFTPFRQAHSLYYPSCAGCPAARVEHRPAGRSAVLNWEERSPQAEVSPAGGPFPAGRRTRKECEEPYGPWRLVWPVQQEWQYPAFVPRGTVEQVSGLRRDLLCPRRGAQPPGLSQVRLPP